MVDYKLTVGLEIHAELKTLTKMFCNSRNDPDEIRPNVNICPVCTGYPGTLPVINKEAVHSILRLGVAVGSELAEETCFDRKNYFYPDIPKGYQISQYKNPLVTGGKLTGVAITRIHLEEDTAKSIHDKDDESLLDFNRAGVPLIELVTEPVIHDAKTASTFAKELQLLLNYLDIANANMEKGEMRIEANISVSLGDTLGTKVEIKNLNSFKSVEKAIDYEYKRQYKLLEAGKKVQQETRGWDEKREETISQRVKEESHDYRYFPDPDLPTLSIKHIPEFNEKELKKSLTELPKEKRERYKTTYNLRNEDIEIYVRDQVWGKYFESVLEELVDKKLIQLASNYITTDLKKPITISNFVTIIKMIDGNEISSRGAKDLLKIIPEAEIDVRKFAEENNLLQISSKGDLKKIVEEVIKENSDAPIQFLVGQAMKKSANRANPVILQELFVEMLNR